MPMFIFVLNFLAFRTHVHWAQILGYTVTLAGVVLTATEGKPDQLLDLALNRGIPDGAEETKLQFAAAVSDIVDAARRIGDLAEEHGRLT